MIYAKKTVRQRAIAFVSLAALFAFSVALFAYYAVTHVPELPTVAVTFGEGKEVFVLEVAQTPAARRHGLMGRTELCEHCGMLFVFPDVGLHTFWMKNTPLSLDMIWVRDNAVVDIVERTTPLSEEPIIPRADASQVIELPAGSVARFGISVGDAVYRRQ